MFEQVAEGFVGLFLFVSNWLSPGATQEDIRIGAIKRLGEGFRIECSIPIGLNDQMSDLIDAGIALRFRISAMPDTGDTIVFIRTLRCDISTYSYFFADTLVAGDPGTVRTSRAYSQLLFALRDYARWTFDVGAGASSCRITAELLPSRASQLNRIVDMSNICGCKKFSRTVAIGTKQNAPRRRR